MTTHAHKRSVLEPEILFPALAASIKKDLRQIVAAGKSKNR